LPTTENGTKRPRDTTVAAVIALLAELYPKMLLGLAGDGADR
jgi:hypothetical protein